MSKKRVVAEYWQFEPTRSIMVAEVSNPIGPAGELFNRWDLDSMPDTTISSSIDGRTKLGDIIRTSSAELILSQRAFELFKRFELGTVRFTPVRIKSNQGEDLIEAFVLTSPFVDFVDLENSQYMTIDNTNPPAFWYFTAPPVVRRQALTGLDFAQGSTVHRVCSSP